MQGEHSEIRGNSKDLYTFVKTLILKIHYLIKKTSYKDKETDKRKKYKNKI